MKRALTVVTNSEMEKFDACPQLHHFVYEEGLRPKLRPYALALGGIIHDGLAVGITAGWSADAKRMRRDDIVEMQVRSARHAAQKKLARWHAEVELSQDAPDYDALDAESAANTAMALFMLGHYFRAVASDLDTLELIAVELPFNVALRDSLGRVLPNLRFAGVMDAVYYDREYDQIVLDEHKTCKGSPQQIERRVEMDPQTSGYIYALREMMAAGQLRLASGAMIPTTGAKVGRIRYNALRKSSPSKPSVNKDGTVSVAAIDTTPEIYAAALEDQVMRGKPITEKQEDLLARLRMRGDTYFARTEYHRTDDELERWRWETMTRAQRIRDARRDPSMRTRNPGHCNMAWSLPCRYRAVCLDPTAPETRAEFRVTTERHTEVVEAIEAKEW